MNFFTHTLTAESVASNRTAGDGFGGKSACSAKFGRNLPW